MDVSWSSDQELFGLIRERLSTAVIGDILDAHGCRHQFLSSELRPLHHNRTLVGRAMPVLEADVFNSTEPFGKMFAALDDLKVGEIYLAAGGSTTYAFFGELMATAAIARGANGAVLCGYHRDTRALLDMDFPIFSYGAYAQDQGVRGRVIEYRIPIEANGVRVEPGDLVVGDIDGVLVVPQQLEEVVLPEAREKASTESAVRKALREGMLVQEAFKKFGVM